MLVIDRLVADDLSAGYADPVARLLLLGEPGRGASPDWLDYPAEFGFGDAHVGELIRMAGDPALLAGLPDSDAVWAPVHAWRALAQLHAEAAIEPLVRLLPTLADDDAADADLPKVFGMIGAAAIAPLARFIADPANEASSVVTAIGGITDIGLRSAAFRSECIDILARVLEPHPQSDPWTNSIAVSGLIDLRAVEAIDAIRAAFGRGGVDLSMAGDIEEVEIALGLRAQRATPAPRHGFLPPAFARLLDEAERRASEQPIRLGPKVGRNEPCPCGSGRKYKKCCLT